MVGASALTRAPRWSSKAAWAAYGAGFAALTMAVLYSAMLGFGVNERCSSRHYGAGYCRRLDWMAGAHAVTEALLATSVVLVLSDRRARGPHARWRSRTTAVAVGYLLMAFTVSFVYTRVAWEWANGSGL